jgi:acyl-CoA synthetase (AMP-forming)/AMP-acid ligase II
VSGPVPQSFNFADLWEAVAPRVAEREALVCGEQRRTYGELAARVNQLARHLQSVGLQPGEHIGLCMPNRVEWLEAFLAAFSIRAVPINLNHRYTSSELSALLENDGARAVVYDDATADEVEPVASKLGLGIVLKAGEDFEAALAAQSSEPLDIERSSDDHYVIYTGGTTGMPKGVVWRQEDAFHACLGGGDPSRLTGPIQKPAEIVDRIAPAMSYLPIAPLMHAAAQWTSLMWLLGGGKTTLMPGSLDPEAVWQAVEDEKVNSITVVGDAVAKPLMDAWDANPDRWDVSSLFAVANGAAPLSPGMKARISATFPDKMMIDGMGSSETGAQGSERLEPGSSGRGTGMAKFTAFADTCVVGEDRALVEPGSGVVGRLALTGHIPLGYHNDPERTAETFVEVDGRRHVITGDMATVEADGSIQLLGRGSQCINTGGEKVFPEEVESALHAHPSVGDVLVVGVPDERWGSAVTAVVAPHGDATPDLEELREHCRATLAGYKLPKHLVVVDRIRRSPAGKANYPWAEALAKTETQGETGA